MPNERKAGYYWIIYSGNVNPEVAYWNDGLDGFAMLGWWTISLPTKLDPRELLAVGPMIPTPPGQFGPA